MENSPATPSISPTPATSEVAELKAQCDQLQQLVSSLLLILIVISGTLTVYLLRQYRSTSADAAALEAAVTPILNEFNNNKSQIEDFVRKLAQYGQTHPDFSPIMLKYRLNEYLPKPGTIPVTSTLPTATGTNK